MGTTRAEDLAAQLLDAQVEFVVAELTGDRLAPAIERFAAGYLEMTASIRASDAVSRESAKTLAHDYVQMVGDSPLIEVMATGVAAAVYRLGAAEEADLNVVIGRDQVEALVRKVLGMREMREHVFERLGQSPVVAFVASWFVNMIVTDFLQTSAGRAERVPGVGQMFGAGRRAARAMGRRSDRHFGEFLGDVAGRGAQLAVRRLGYAVRETVDGAPLYEAAMEIWDLQAAEPMSGLRDYLTERDLADLVSIIYGMWLNLRNTDYFADALDAGIDVFYDNYGSFTLGRLLAELGVGTDRVLADAQLLAPALIEAMRATGVLEQFVRAQLEPFWRSERVQALLG